MCIRDSINAEYGERKSVMAHSHGAGHSHEHAHTPISPKMEPLIKCQVEQPHEITDHMLFGVPKKGRLFEKVNALLEACGLDYNRPNRVDIAHCKSLPITIVFLPAADIATYVGEGNVDLGITGEDIVAESEADVNVVMRLGFGKCKLAVQAPLADEIKDPSLLLGKRVVTSFPNVARNYFAQLQAELGNEAAAEACQIKFVSGSVEAACGLGLADAIVDLVETGTTMKAAGLEIVSSIMQTQSVLISNKHSPHTQLIEKLRKRIDGYITATQYVMVNYNICLLYTSDAADEEDSVDLGGRRIIKKKKNKDNGSAVGTG
eukprot:TRINITY_DN21553_c0_g1_i10.p1 TRINITY_DN21553_c0_g1~~TRINITY_DN21553_c0_g1_i10.p1  ORF type:complete len:319 (-),score=80.91 TRINITY_DN21553_c0_g1_i10:54-1010(-)